MSPRDRLLRRKLIVVTGKGGVGKSAIASVLGHSLARRGRRTLLLEVDPRENLHQMLGVAPSGGEILPVAENLYLQNLKPQDVVDWVVEKQVRIKMLVRRVLKSPIYHRFVEGAPGLTEIAILGHALRLARGDLRHAPDLDTVVLDAPATGHGVYLLTAPKLFADAIMEGRTVWETTRRDKAEQTEQTQAATPSSVADRVRAREARRERVRAQAKARGGGPRSKPDEPAGTPSARPVPAGVEDSAPTDS